MGKEKFCFHASVWEEKTMDKKNVSRMLGKYRFPILPVCGSGPLAIAVT